MKTIIAFMALLIVSINNAYPKPDKIKGTIMSQQKGEPLEGCSISLYKNDTLYDTKLSNEKGEFVFYRILSGEYIITVEKDLYHIEKKVITIAQSNLHTHYLMFRMEDSIPMVAHEGKNIL